MNKFKKTAMIVTSIIMAGTMAFGFAACGGESTVDPEDPSTSTDDPSTPSTGGSDDDGTSGTSGGLWTSSASTGATSFVNTLKSTYGLTTRVTSNGYGWETADSYWTYLKSTISDSVSSSGPNLSYTSGTEINIAIGYNSTSTGAFYSGLTGSTTIPGGYSATSGNLKPAFQAIQSALGVTFVDSYSGKSTSANLDDLKSNNKWGTVTDIATMDLSVAVSSYNTNGDILNLGDYLDQMPNFKAFLEENPVVYLSLLQDGMSTTDGSNKTILVAPYFDGNDDIERYCLIRQDWVVDLLDSTLAYDGTTYAASCASSTSVSGGWMGATGNYSVETSTEADAGATTFELTKDYDAALAAVQDTTTALGTAYNAIAGSAYSGTSGNIVDIMNAAINANNGATGKQLATLYRAYIDVAYLDEDGNSAYGDTRSNLFNGYSAAWDVDDLVAMLRIVKTNAQNVGLDADTEITGIFPRDASNDRTPDIVRLAAQLYGERGADSRYEYTYIDANGELQDARANTSFYQALENFGELAAEGLVANYVEGSISASGLKGNCTTSAGTGFMMYDYSQTQTTQMYDLSDSSPDTDYLFAAINTPVSRWDDNSDGTKDTIMRFTESWRSTKTSGLAVAASVANDSNLLNAVLTFIDYLYSNDGQILSTFGIQSTNGNTNPNGTWYGNEVTNVSIDTVAEKVGGQYVVKDEYASQYFCFGDKLYTGTLYKGEMTPIVTTELYNSFIATDGVNAVTNLGSRGSFTTYARQVLGATLPMGVKNQSFENQLTATQAAAEATKVSASLSNGTIKHVTLSIDSSAYWYACVPTGLPLDTDSQSNIDATSQNDLKYMTGTKAGSDKNFYSIFHWIIFYGYTGEYNQQGVVYTF